MPVPSMKNRANTIMYDFFSFKNRPLEGVQSCLKTLREKMVELQQEVYEQAKSSSTWKYKLGFTCEKCEMKW